MLFRSSALSMSCDSSCVLPQSDTTSTSMMERRMTRTGRHTAVMVRDDAIFFNEFLILTILSCRREYTTADIQLPGARPALVKKPAVL